MGQVLKFPAPQCRVVQKKGPDQNKLWMCTTCECRSFQLDSDGHVWCWACKSFVNNLKVTT